MSEKIIAYKAIPSKMASLWRLSREEALQQAFA
jgi:hypothetical protein